MTSIVDNQFWEAAKKYPEFSNGDIQVFIDSYHEFDADGNGVIDTTELAAVLKSMGQGSSPRDVQMLVDRYATKGTSYIEFTGFLEMMRYFYPSKRLDFIKNFVEPSEDFPEFTNNDLQVFLDTYREFDEDESGTIDIYELGKLLRSMGQGCNEERLKKLIQQFGSNGVINWAGFLAIMRSFYPEKKRAYERKFYEPAKNFPEFSKDEVDVFIRNFKDFDLDGNGSIDTDELAVAFKKMGMGVNKETLDGIMRRFDADRNGTVEWPEFLAIMRSFYPYKLVEFEQEFYEPAKNFPDFNKEDIDVFIAAFREYDLDGSGTIDADELDYAFKQMGQGCTREKLQEIITDVDKNGNGVIEWSEFLQIMHNIYNGKYSNKPGAAAATKPVTAATPSSGGFKPASPSGARTVGVGAHRPGAATGPTKCASCGKTVYPTEAITAVNQTWHKLCFKCQEPGCDLTLNLKNFFGHGDRVYCSQHLPKSKPTATTVEGSFATKNAISAPKLKMAAGVKKDNRMTFAPGQLKPIGENEPEPQE